MKIEKSKASDDFYEWLELQEVAPYKVMFEDIPEFIQISYLIEWLDSILIIIETDYERLSKQYYGNVIDYRNCKNIKVDFSNNFGNRTSVLKSAIEKVFEIY